jgi:trigger factor
VIDFITELADVTDMPVSVEELYADPDGHDHHHDHNHDHGHDHDHDHDHDHGHHHK